MEIVANILVGLVALEHLYILYLEMLGGGDLLYSGSAGFISPGRCAAEIG
jgi:hypothetical protein